MVKTKVYGGVRTPLSVDGNHLEISAIDIGQTDAADLATNTKRRKRSKYMNKATKIIKIV